MKKEFKEVFESKEKIKYCKILKCEINTIQGEVVVKKGFPINQSYLKKQGINLMNLEQKG